jgi:hypothetical protein
MIVQVTFKGNGILGGIQVIADAHGSVKGKVGNPAADLPLRPDGKLDVGAAVGRGEQNPSLKLSVKCEGLESHNSSLLCRCSHDGMQEQHSLMQEAIGV